MKFAKELEQSLVPEWRVKYLDYKQGKKKVKAVARATNRITSTPRSDVRTSLNPQSGSLYGATSPLAPRRPQPSGRFDGTTAHPQSSSGRRDEASHGTRDEAASSNSAASIPIASKHVPTEHTHDGMYGSFVPTPPAMDMHNFELPDPAIEPGSPLESSERIMSTVTSRRNSLETDVPARTPERNPLSAYQSAYEVGTTESPTRPKFASLRAPGSRAESHDIHEQPILKRIFSVGAPLTKSHSRPDVDLVAFDYVRIRQQEFLSWMDKELEKVETFYRSKEDEAGIRLQALREQLHEMRNRRIQELAEAEHARSIRKDDERSAMGKISRGNSGDEDLNKHSSQEHRMAWLAPFGRMVDNAKATALGPHPGANSRALASMRNSPELQFKSQPDDAVTTNGNRDYVRRPYENDVSYRTAKRKLKLALQEHYRGMELLKSYALLNRTAFRKINKKYDKATNAHPPLRFMTEKVSKAWFVNSDVLDGHIHTVEDLYARYFEKGNHKIAVGKLRKTVGRSMDQSGSAFRNGVLIGIGAVFSIQGIISGTEYLNHPDPTIRFQTGYLLQIYGGYFLGLYLFSLFCFDCSVWTRNKINYKFVFEFDPRHDLDWRQLSEFPAFLILLFGLFLWINFSGYGTPEMFIYYPIILIFVTLMIIFMPAPIIFHRSRKWFVYSHWRLLLAGLYPVEFRDFFLVNGGKYAMTIVYYVTLSIYRIDRDRSNLIAFSFFAALNAVYVSTWDLLMDWSLLQPGANKPFLRDVRGFKSTWWYYAAMIIDPILRFNWIFYSIYTHDLQHSSSVSFFVGLSEITRRGMWTLFRVENEHCSNVARFKAFRDVALPYDLESGESEESQPITPVESVDRSTVLDRERTHTSGLSRQQTNASSARRRPQRTFTKVLADAHTQDFQKKKKPIADNAKDLDGTDENDVDMDRATSSEDDDDDEQDAQDRLDVDNLVRTGQGKGRRKSRRGV
ncbi:putative signal transduction protein [Botrytis cinerea BcDW1]|uniref:Putative signal transduction protein n=1 Tax=Botryotinia fuckeliana (strain BcDW1) TaxID=1290391 RepID=M7TUI7_BOTF1|nr:putative signal transduction protein [Botrytis cinerea BcDW1]